jgi:diadenylate cyclase
VDNLFAELSFFIERVDILTIVDLVLVTIVVFFLLRLVRGTQAVVLLRGIIVLVISIALLTTLLDLPAFSWILRNAFPALLIAIPVIFAPEIRRALERLGRTGSVAFLSNHADTTENTIDIVCTTAQRLSDNRFGALVVLEREDRLQEFKETGVQLDAALTPELLLQIFYVNTPLHDGAVIISGGKIAAAACVLPLSSSGTLSRSPERQMGLRHRAALGISEVSDSVSVVVSEETGGISITHNGRMIRRLDQARLRNILTAFFRPRATGKLPDWLDRFLFRRSPLKLQARGDGEKTR